MHATGIIPLHHQLLLRVLEQILNFQNLVFGYQGIELHMAYISCQALSERQTVVLKYLLVFYHHSKTNCFSKGALIGDYLVILLFTW